MRDGSSVDIWPTNLYTPVSHFKKSMLSDGSIPNLPPEILLYIKPVKIIVLIIEPKKTKQIHMCMKGLCVCVLLECKNVQGLVNSKVTRTETESKRKKARGQFLSDRCVAVRVTFWGAGRLRRWGPGRRDYCPWTWRSSAEWPGWGCCRLTNRTGWASQPSPLLSSASALRSPAPSDGSGLDETDKTEILKEILNADSSKNVFFYSIAWFLTFLWRSVKRKRKSIYLSKLKILDQ